MSGTPSGRKRAMVVESGHIVFRMRRFGFAENISGVFEKKRNSPLLKVSITVR
jgi:hypothetical protein